MTTKVNLFNLSDGKTREVINYVESLELPIDFSLKESKRFNEIKKEASQLGLTANQMLDIIGYSPVGIDEIFGD